jgi:sec-independent protein translocase protein TatB
VLNFDFWELAMIGGVALVVLGPEKLPRAARTVGALVGKAQRYVADVKAEVNRSIELEELQKMKSHFETAARDVESSVRGELDKQASELNGAWDPRDVQPEAIGHSELPPNSGQHSGWTPLPDVARPRKNWRLKRGATPQWYKQKAGVRTRALSGAARVARFRPPRAS